MAPGVLSEIETIWAPFWAGEAVMAGVAAGVDPEPEELPPPHPHIHRPKSRTTFTMAAPVLNEFSERGGSAVRYPPPPMKAVGMCARQSFRIHIGVTEAAKARRSQ